MHSRAIISIAWLQGRYGGAHRYLEAVIEEIRRDGGQCHLVVNRNPWLAEFLARVAETGATVHEIEIERSPEGAARRLDDVIADVEPDLVHFNSGARPARRLAILSRAMRRRNFGTCLTMHLPLIAEGKSVGFRQRIPFSYGWNRSRESARFARLFDRIISVSARCAEHVAAALGVPADRFDVIPNGVSTERIVFPDRDATRRPVVIGGCGNLVRQKRFDVLIRAVAEVAQSHDVALCVAGSGVLNAELRALARKLGIEDRVQLLGHQSNMSRFFGTVDVFAMTSDHEAFPYAQLEAMASGLPSVVTGVGELPVVVRDGVEGFVCRPGDVASVADRLARLVADPDLRVELGRNARERVLAEYTQARCMERTMHVFRSVMEGRRAAVIASR